MEEPSREEEVPHAAAIPSTSPPKPGLPRRRPTCESCSRPSPVCLCTYLPARPIETETHVVVVVHPHEARHKLSTTPALTRCLANSSAVVARRLRRGLSPLLDKSPPPSAVYLFPSTDPAAVPLSALAKLHPRPSVLVAFDATWRHAGEMVRASEGYLRQFATRAFLEFNPGVGGGSIYDSELVLRKEPFGGCVSTMEAVARALGVVEPNGPVIEDTLIRVLREMVRLQAQFLKPTKPRPKLEKKNMKERKKAEEEEERESGGCT